MHYKGIFYGYSSCLTDSDWGTRKEELHGWLLPSWQSNDLMDNITTTAAVTFFFSAWKRVGWQASCACYHTWNLRDFVCSKLLGHVIATITHSYLYTYHTYNNYTPYILSLIPHHSLQYHFLCTHKLPMPIYLHNVASGVYQALTLLPSTSLRFTATINIEDWKPFLYTTIHKTLLSFSWRELNTKHYEDRRRRAEDETNYIASSPLTPGHRGGSGWIYVRN